MADTIDQILGVVIFTIVAIGMGATLIQTLIVPATTLTAVNDEQFNITNLGVTPLTITLANTPLDTIVIIENATGQVELTTPGNYSVLSTTLSQINISNYDNATSGDLINVTYSFQGDGYVSSSIARVVLGFVLVLFAVGVLAVVGRTFSII